MSLKTVFNFELSDIIKYPKRDEIDLFRAFKAALSSGANALEFHGNKHQVEYDDPFIIGNKVSCELCDLLLVTYNLKEVRFTFMQNKSKTERISSGKKINSRYKGLHNTSDIPIRQQYLLGHFPEITGVGVFSIPNRILINRNANSIGSFGVFYNDSYGEFDMCYSIAAFMKTGTGFRIDDFKRNSRKLYEFEGFPNNVLPDKTFWEHSYLYSYWYKRLIDEVQCTNDLDSFEYFLRRMLVGNRLSESDFDTKNFIVDALKKVANNNKNNNNAGLLKDVIGKMEFNDKQIEYNEFPDIIAIHIRENED